MEDLTDILILKQVMLILKFTKNIEVKNAESAQVLKIIE